MTVPTDARILQSVDAFGHSETTELRNRRRQQSAVAHLGQRALGNLALQDLMNESVALIAETLSVEFAKVLELSQDGKAFTLRAGVGWTQGSVGSVTVKAGADSQAGYTLLSKEPVIVEDLRVERRFHGPALLLDHGVVSGMSVIIAADGAPFGVLGLHSSRHRIFNRDDIHFLQGAANILAAAIERQKRTDALRRSNRALQVLSECNQALTRATEESAFLSEVCRIIVHSGGYRLAWVGLTEDGGQKLIRPVAQCGDADGYLTSITIAWDDSELGLGPCGTAIRRGKPSITRNISTDVTFKPWRHRALKRGFASAISLPLLSGGQAFGGLTVYSPEPDAFDDNEVELLAALASDITSGIHALRSAVERTRAEEAQRESEARFRAFIEHAADIFVVLNFDGTLRYQSPSAEQLTGYPLSQIQGMSAFEFVHPDDRSRATAAFHELVRNEGAVLTAEFRVIHKNGTWRQVEGIGKGLLSFPPVGAIIVNIRDVTECRETERRLQESEENLRQLTDHIEGVFWLIKLDTREVVYVSSAYDRIWQRTRESLYANCDSWLEAIHPDDRKRVSEAYSQLPFAGRFDQEYRLVTANNSIIWIRHRAFPVHDSSGRIVRAAVFAENITKLKRTRQALATRQRELVALHRISRTFMSASDLKTLPEQFLSDIATIGSFDVGEIRLTDAYSRILAEAVYGPIPRRDMRGRVFTGETVAPKVLADRKTLIIGDLAQSAGLSRWRNAGVRSAIVIPINADTGVLGLMLLGRFEIAHFDSTLVHLLETLANHLGVAVQKARLYEETRQQALALETSNNVKNDFLSVISHELRTPLNTIMGQAALLQDELLGKIEPAQKAALGAVLDSAHDLTLMVNRILQATGIDAGKVSIERAHVNVSRILDGLRASYKVSKNKDLSLVWDYPPSLASISTDEDKLRQILINLIDNALKFTPSGEVAISARFLAEQNKMEFKIQDTGIGMDRSELPKIFESFRQLDNSETRAHEGMGLGLYLAKSFTELLGGQIEVQSEFHKGSVFTVTIPSL